MLVALSAQRDNERGPRYAEQALAAIHQADKHRRGFQLEYGRRSEEAGLYLRFPIALKTVIEGQFAAHYPYARQLRISEDALESSASLTWSVNLRLQPSILPMRRSDEFENSTERTLSDPLAGLLTALNSDATGDLQCRIVINVKPASLFQRWWARRILVAYCSHFFHRHESLAGVYVAAATSSTAWRIVTWPLTWLLKGPSDTSNSNRQITLANEKLNQHLYSTTIVVQVSGAAGASSKAVRKVQEICGAFGQFTEPGSTVFRCGRISNKRKVSRRRSEFLLSTQELALLWHLPVATVRSAKMEHSAFRELEPPVQLPSSREKDVAVLGETAFRTRKELFGIRTADRRRHLAIIGKTGMGKSTLLQRLMVSDIQAGRGVGIIDPHGDLADELLKSIPRRRTNDVVLFDAGDTSHPPAWNPLSCADKSRAPLVAAGVLTALKKQFGDSWGPRLENLLRNTLLALLATPNADFAAISTLLTDDLFRRRILSKVGNAEVKRFFETRFESWPDRYRQEAIEPVLNKIGQFLSNPQLCRILSAPKNRIQLRSTMDRERILIVNLSKGRIGEDATSLLGSLLISDLQQQAMSRADLVEEQRKDFFLYIDEYQNFATGSFATILSEARKYRLSLILANQYLAQMDEETRNAVFGNVGSLLSFQVGVSDAEELASQFAGDVAATDLVTLPQFTAYVRLLINGMPGRPFSMRTLPPKRIARAQKESIFRKRKSQASLHSDVRGS